MLVGRYYLSGWLYVVFDPMGLSFALVPDFIIIPHTTCYDREGGSMLRFLNRDFFVLGSFWNLEPSFREEKPGGSYLIVASSLPFSNFMHCTNF